MSRISDAANATLYLLAYLENPVNLTLLLDLDDTLLVNDVNVFLPAYLKALSAYLSDYADPTRLVNVLIDATGEMIKNNQPNLTLKEVFDAAFYPGLGITARDVNGAIQSFYSEVFPKLKNLTHPMDGAADLVEEAFRRGFRVAIATNPLFPRTAIDQRLDWAGLSPKKYAFSFVPSYETFHFAKPNPAYFGELLGSIGWPEAPVVMVGDDLANDIKPARDAGLPVYWLGEASPSTAMDSRDFPGGLLSELLSWVDASPPEKLQPDFTRPNGMLAILRSTPAALQALTSQVETSRWSQRPSQDEWSHTEVLCHLRDVEVEVNLPRVSRVLEETNPFIPGKDTDPWAEEREYIRQDGMAALNDFIQARLKLLAMLDQISSQSWQRQARHAIFGPTTLAELINITAGHDRLHIHQIYKNMYPASEGAG
jgi:FMN phosphatase YigB (HAD superfamily)